MLRNLLKTDHSPEAGEALWSIERPVKKLVLSDTNLAALKQAIGSSKRREKENREYPRTTSLQECSAREVFGRGTRRRREKLAKMWTF